MNENEKNMQPDASPGEQSKSGVRKVNDVPLYILFAGIAGFLLIMVLVASDRASNQNKPLEDEALVTVKNATNFVSELTAGYENGIIQPVDVGASGSTVEDVPVDNRDLGEKPNVFLNASTPVKGVNDKSASDLNPRDKNDFFVSDAGELDSEREDLIRFKMARLQLLEQGIKGKMSVNGFKNGNTLAFSDTPQSQLNNVRTQIQNTPTDPTVTYKARLEELKSIIDGTGATPSINNISQSLGSSGEKAAPQNLSNTGWRLNNAIDTPETPYILRSGYVIPGLLISGINSDLPGQIMAQVSQDVYDTPTGKNLLIPQGTRLVGAYDSEVAYGQARVLVAWNRMIFPDGKALDIGGMQGADSAGYAGYKDRLNTHFFKVISSAFLLSGIVAGVNLSQDDSSNGSSQRSSDALSEALGQQLGQVLTQLITKNLNVSPTIEIRPGYRFNVMVSKDIVFNKPYQSFDY